MRMLQPADHVGLHNCKNDNEWKRPHPYFNLLIEEREMAIGGSQATENGSSRTNERLTGQWDLDENR
jgi:hypothetical protein